MKRKAWHLHQTLMLFRWKLETWDFQELTSRLGLARVIFLWLPLRYCVFISVSESD